MSRQRSAAIRVLRPRVKDKHASWLAGLRREVNAVFNYCNELSARVYERERRFLSGFDFWPFLKGVTRGDCALNLPEPQEGSFAQTEHPPRQDPSGLSGRRGRDTEAFTLPTKRAP